MPLVYLDHNATTPLLPEVADAMDHACRLGYANPASQHQAGRIARRRLEESRQAIAEALGASTAGARVDRLLLTSGGTESNNHALRSVLAPNPAEAHLIVSAIEHPSIAGEADWLASRGVQVDRLGVDPNGVVKVAELPSLLRSNTRLVSVMLGNNETGVLQPVEEVVAICAERGVPVHTDATQVVGKLPVDFTRLGVAMLTFAGHKFHGPHGIGGLLVRAGFEAPPLLHGQAGAERPGTPAIALAVGMQSALEAWNNKRDERRDRVAGLRDLLESRVLSADPAVRVVGGQAERLPHTSCLSFVGLDRQAMQMALDRCGVACSTGSACASGSSEPSPVLLAMGLPQEVVQGALRFSLGATTTAAEVELAAHEVQGVAARLRSRK